MYSQIPFLNTENVYFSDKSSVWTQPIYRLTDVSQVSTTKKCMAALILEKTCQSWKGSLDKCEPKETQWFKFETGAASHAKLTQC